MSPSGIVHFIHEPILAPLLKNRTLCIAITAAGILHLSLTVLELPSWRSPFHALLGIPDPGCGLSRATIALLRGDWRTSLVFHAFAPLFVVALTLIALNAVLPSLLRDKVTASVKGVEQHTGLAAILLIGLVIYWLARLLLMREVFINLIAG